MSIVTEFGQELGLLATNVIRKYELAGTAPFVVASGSLFTRTGPLLFGAFRDFVLAADPSARVELSRRPPVAGAVRAALQGSGGHTSTTWERSELVVRRSAERLRAEDACVVVRRARW